jgi:quercetin dioxygenase-like cupin family protein
MTRAFEQPDAPKLNLPGRTALELVSGTRGSRGVTLRLVEIPVVADGESPRAPHQHHSFEECIFVLSGEGTTHADSGDYALRAGDTLLVSPGDKHATRNTGAEPLRLLCFFPVADIAADTGDPRADAEGSTPL